MYRSAQEQQQQWCDHRFVKHRLVFCLKYIPLVSLLGSNENTFFDGVSGKRISFPFISWLEREKLGSLTYSKKVIISFFYEKERADKNLWLCYRVFNQDDFTPRYTNRKTDRRQMVRCKSDHGIESATE